MARIFKGRYAARIQGPFVVFAIGMRFNQPWKFWKWGPVFMAMPKMIKLLEQHPDKGFLGAEQFLYWPGAALVQYWRSFEHLDRFARDTGDPHLDVWRQFNRRIGADGSVGIWHETYLVNAGRYEAVYCNMPRFGLGKVGEHARATGDLETARRRLGEMDEPAVPSY